MSNQLSDKEVLQKVIQKAISGGWKLKGFIILDTRVEFFKPGTLPVYLETDEIYSWVDDNDVTHKENNGQALSTESIIFNHDFAKALWGDGEPRKYNGFNMETGKMMTKEEKEKYIPKSTPVWKVHLQRMVISPNPIHYLREHAL